MNAILNGGKLNRVDMVTAARIATILILTATAALAITGLVPSHDRAAAQPGVESAKATAPLSVAQESRPAGSFAFGYVEFDWDPSAPGGVPGFDSWPSAAPR